MLVLGYMSGTSLDGVDAALIETDGDRIVGLDACFLSPFSDAERAVIERATADALAWNGHGEPPPSFVTAEEVVHDVHVRAGREAIARAGRVPELIGFHGQTVLHRPERRVTVQIGDAARLANAMAVPVIADLRRADIEAGGQGAPIVPVYHRALMEMLGLAGPIAFLNLGGVANLTFIGADGELVACDTGPANGLIDQLVQAHGMGRYDDGGRLAAAGTVQEPALAALLDHPHFRASGPRSLDRYDFPLDWAAAYSLPDALATLVAFTAEAVAVAARRLPTAPALWILCGGGCHNPVLVAALRDRLGACRTTDDLGIGGDFVEAQAMGYLAARSVRGLPMTFPGTTGTPNPLPGGVRYDAGQYPVA